MSTKKKPIDHKEALKALKSFGILKSVSNRGKLTASQKSTVRRNWDKYSEIITAPKTGYVTKDISHYDTKEKRALEKSGYKIINNKIYIDKQGSDDATVKRISSRVKKVGDKSEHYDSYVVILREKSGRKVETEFIGTATQKEGWRQNMLSQYHAGEFKKGDYIGIKIGSGGIFQRRMYQSIDDIFKYAEYDFDPKDAGTDKDFLLNKMHLVKLSVKDYRDLASTEKTKKEKNHDKYMRAKKAKQLKVVKHKAKSKNSIVGKTRHK